jgi:hypothetical protein
MTSRLLDLAPALSPQRWVLARGSRLLGLVLSGLLLSACAVGPDYQRPRSGHARGSSRKPRAGARPPPSDALARGAWWELYGDQQLNGLVESLNRANQTVAQSEAQFRQAQALVRSARGAFFPSADLSVGKTRSSQGTGSSNSSLTSSSSGIRDTLNAQVGVSWEADVWGKLRRGLEANDRQRRSQPGRPGRHAPEPAIGAGAELPAIAGDRPAEALAGGHRRGL